MAESRRSDDNAGPFVLNGNAIGQHAIIRRTSSGGSSQDILPPGSSHRLVKRELYPIHIFLIVISGTIGMGLFNNSGEILSIAGPAGSLIAYIVVGAFVICVMEGIAEMIGHWPIANSLVEFVKTFVDKDLSIVVGLAYWYAYSISFATLVIAASDLATYWTWSNPLQYFLFIAGVPFLLLAINCLGVFWYGNVEAVMGILKITLVAGAFLTMCIINPRVTSADTPTGVPGHSFIEDGFRNNLAVASNPAIAVLVAIPIVTYAYIGVEIVAVTALEANSPKTNLKYPAMLIAWITAIIYFVCAVSFYVDVSWMNPLLPSFPNRSKDGPTVSPAPANSSKTNSIVIIAAMSANIPTLPGFLNGCLILAILSAANIALYVASRTLFGLTQEIDPNSRWWGWVSKFSTTTHNRRVPTFALVASVLIFCWVPFLHLTKSYSYQYLKEIMSGIATVAVVLVWGCECLAFIRYRRWLKKFKDKSPLNDAYREYNHWSTTSKYLPFTTILSGFQPIPAYLGGMFCVLTVFVFATSSWWNGRQNRVDVIAAFIGPALLLLIWLCLKVKRFMGPDFEWYVNLGPWEQLQPRLDNLRAAIETDRPRGRGIITQNGHSGHTGIEMNHVAVDPPTPRAYETSASPTERTDLGVSVVGAAETDDDSRQTPSPRTHPAIPRKPVMAGGNGNDLFARQDARPRLQRYRGHEGDGDRINFVNRV